MIGDLLDLVEIIGIIFELPQRKRRAKENLAWVKQQIWYSNYAGDPKWDNMLNHDKKLRRILGLVSNKKLINDKKVQELLKKDLVSHYEMWKIGWKIK